MIDDVGYIEEVKEARRRLNALYLSVDSIIADDIKKHVEEAFTAIKKTSEPIKVEKKK